ncbi:2,4-dienoyl-CoA reductase [Desulfurella multipotens]|uniref:2,4-dienoyl-CoA reductase n=1 Tax=Desulfurella multipotens TaxID=79269 RepID=A0A1G6QEV7_9BACT|nr:FAD-dependent oxidoreductase [Desulfurella multipotens]SDC90226.1 2,4-dienoyl-CoA reductase [Desulfurella multipotens]
MKIEGKSLGLLHLKNPFIAAPVKTAYADLESHVNQRHLNYYENLAKGGVALIIIEPTAVLKSGREHPKQLCIDEDYCIDELSKITRVIHDNGSLACINLNHAGRAANPKASGVVLAPSAVMCPSTMQTPKELTKEQIKEIVKAFGKATVRAKKAGFDAIEIQAGMGYLIAQFLKDRTNKRNDEYGKDKLLFAKEVFGEVANFSNGLELILRVSANEFVEDGIVEQDNVELINLAKKYGIKAVHAGLGNACDTPLWYYSYASTPTDKQIESFKKLKSLIDLPIIIDGRMGNPDRIKALLEEGWVDFFGLGRSLVADQYFVNKLLNDELDKIWYCGGCLQGCLYNVRSGIGLGCITNPFVDKKFFEPSGKKLKVCIAGGGPAGIATGIYAKMKGYDAIVFEKKELGGQFILATKAPYKDAMLKPLNALINEAKRRGVEFRYEEANYEKLKEQNPDLVVVATGANSQIPNIKGIENEYVIDAFSFFESVAQPKGKRVLVLGIGLIGREAMEILANQGFEVVGVDILSELTQDFTLTRLKNNPNVKIFVATSVEEFTNEGVFARQEDEVINLGKFDTIISSIGTKPNKALYEQIKDKFKNVEIIGDAARVADIYTATQSAYELISRY